MSKISKKAQALKSVISGASEDPADDIVPNARFADQHQLGDAAKQAAAAEAAEAHAAATQEKLGSLPGTSAVADASSTQDDPFGTDLFGSPVVPTRDGDGEGLLPGTDPAELINKGSDPTDAISSTLGDISKDIDSAGDLVQDNSPGGGSFVPNLESGGQVVETELVNRSTTPYFRETHANGSQTVTQGPTEFVEANDQALADGRKIIDAVTGEESNPVDLFAEDGMFGMTENYVSEAVLASVLDASQKVEEGRTDAEANLEAEANAAADEVLFGEDNFFVDETSQFFLGGTDDAIDPLEDNTTEEEANKEFDSLFPEEEKNAGGSNDENNGGNNDGGGNDENAGGGNTGGSNDENAGGGNTGGGNDEDTTETETDEDTTETETDEGADASNEADGSTDAENSASTPATDDPTSDQAIRNRQMVEDMGLNGENRTRNDNLIDPVENEEVEGEGTGYVPPISIPEQDIIQPPESLDSGRQVPTDKGDIDYGPDYDDTDTPGGGSIPDSGGIHVAGGDVLAPLHAADLIADAPAAANPAIAPEVAAAASDTGAVTTLSAEAAKAPEISGAIATPDLGAQAIDAIGADLDVDSDLSFSVEAPASVEADLETDDVDGDIAD